MTFINPDDFLNFDVHTYFINFDVFLLYTVTNICNYSDLNSNILVVIKINFEFPEPKNVLNYNIITQLSHRNYKIPRFKRFNINRRVRSTMSSG